MEEETGGARAGAGEGQVREIQPPPPPQAPDHYRFTTDGIPREGKFETWRDLWKVFGEARVSTDSPASFDGRIELWCAGPLTAVDLNVTQSLYERTANFARNGCDDFSLTLCSRDTIVETATTGPLALRPGGAFFLSHDHRYTIAPPGDCPTRVLRIDRGALLALMPRDFRIPMRVFTPGNRILRLVENMVPLLTSKTEPTGAEKRATIGQHVVDLVALMLNPSRDGREQIERRGLKAARIGAVLRTIDSEYGRPQLSAELVGHSLGISARQVHRLLEETTKTFYEHLLERRLLRAHDLLTTASTPHGKIVDIAADAGFTDVTHFNHTFRARFGDTPTGVRRNAAATATLNHLWRSLAGGRP
ncbi:MAG: AraC family transcriptional regulator [Methyloceanibacter sp.]|uniref:AraC family transcriptional regulator n=1 Tax=Methyloceanibacter sp. TaxID=1965321 RepID=UPI003D6D277E